MAAEMGAVWSFVFILIAVFAALYLFFEVLGWAPGAPSGAGSAK